MDKKITTIFKCIKKVVQLWLQQRYLNHLLVDYGNDLLFWSKTNSSWHLNSLSANNFGHQMSLVLVESAESSRVQSRSHIKSSQCLQAVWTKINPKCRAWFETGQIKSRQCFTPRLCKQFGPRSGQSIGPDLDQVWHSDFYSLKNFRS